MANELTINVKNLPAEIANLFGADDNDELSEGLTESFPILSIKGSKWSIRFQDEIIPVTNADGDSLSAMEVVIIQANPHISKTYYKSKYSDGAAEAPDCSSINGDTPDPYIENPVSKSCKGCPMNAWGSRITENGKEAKACSDSRRLAIVPSRDIPNSMFNGMPMLLRVPATSLKDLAAYSRKLKSVGVSYRAVVTKISFDASAAYPKLKFKAVRVLTEEEMLQVAEHVKHETFKPLFTPNEAVHKSEFSESASKVAAKEKDGDDDMVPEEIIKEAQRKTATLAKAKPAKKKEKAASKAEPEPEPEPETAVEASSPDIDAVLSTDSDVVEASSDLEDELNSILKGLE